MNLQDRLPFGERLRRGEFKTATEARAELKKAKVSDSARADYLIEIARLEAVEERDEGKERHILADIVPDGWFLRYLGFCRASESPLMFHMMCALASFSHLIGKKRYFFLPGRSIYAPVNVLLVSPAGLARRGEAIEPAARIARKVGARVIQDQASMEGLVEALMKNPRALFIAEEASTLLSAREYMSDVPQFLCRLLDCPKEPVERNLRSAVVKVKNPTLNVILSSAPDWFGSMPATAVGGGLLSRMIVVYESTREKMIPFPEDVAKKKTLEREEETLVNEATVLVGGLKLARLQYRGKAKTAYRNFYRDVGKEIRAVPENMIHWIGRKPAHVHRIVMSYLVAAGREDAEVDVETFDRAVALVKIAEEKMEQAYRHAGQNVHEKKRQKIVDALQTLGGVVGKSELFRKVGFNFKDATEFNDYLQSLIDRREAFVEEQKTKTRPKVMVVLRGKER